VRDINRYTIVSMAEEIGCIPLFFGIAKDHFEDLKAKIEFALKETDMVVITAAVPSARWILQGRSFEFFRAPKSLATAFRSDPENQHFLRTLEESLFSVCPGTPFLLWSSSIFLVKRSSRFCLAFREKGAGTR